MKLNDLPNKNILRIPTFIIKKSDKIDRYVIRNVKKEERVIKLVIKILKKASKSINRVMKQFNDYNKYTQLKITDYYK